MSKSDEQVSFEAGALIAEMIERGHGQPLTENQECTAIAAWGKDAMNSGILTENQVAAFQAGMDAWFTGSQG